MTEPTTAYDLTEERKTELDLSRLAVSHSLTLHRDSVSVADIKAMIRQLEAAGMPEHATLDVRASTEAGKHTRLWATWHTEPSDGADDEGWVE